MLVCFLRKLLGWPSINNDFPWKTRSLRSIKSCRMYIRVWSISVLHVWRTYNSNNVKEENVWEKVLFFSFLFFLDASKTGRVTIEFLSIYCPLKYISKYIHMCIAYTQAHIHTYTTSSCAKFTMTIRFLL